jgi:hypothetical protein
MLMPLFMVKKAVFEWIRAGHKTTKPLEYILFRKGIYFTYYV